MKIAIIGTGRVGSKLGALLAAKGHKIIYGSRDPEAFKVKKLLASQPKAQAMAIAAAAEAGEAILVCTPGFTQDMMIKNLGTQLAPGAVEKTVIDVTNPVTATLETKVLVPHGGESAAEVLQKQMPRSFVFKAFNTLGIEVFEAAPKGAAGRPLSLLYAGPEEQKDVCERLVADVGFRPELVGPIRFARDLEVLAELWMHMAQARGRRMHLQLIDVEGVPPPAAAAARSPAARSPGGGGQSQQ